MMWGKVGFDGYRFCCIIGDLPEERTQEQELVVDLRVEVDFSRVATSDQLVDTIDYTRMAAICVEVGKNGRFAMLEAYAAAVLNAIKAEFSPRNVAIRVKKGAALPGALCAVVELEG